MYNANKLYTILIVVGIVIEAVLLLFFDKDVVAFGPVIFWVIAAFLILNNLVLVLMLSSSVSKSKPELYKSHSFGIMLTRQSLTDKEFLNALNEKERRILSNIKAMLKYFFICFCLFALSGFLIFLK